MHAHLRRLPTGSVSTKDWREAEGYHKAPPPGSATAGCAAGELLRRLLAGELKRQVDKSGELEEGVGAWLGGRDSNPDSAVQSRMSYH